MRTARLFCALLASSAAALAPAALAASFSYQLDVYPASATDCHGVARDLGARLAAMTGVDVTRAICAGASELGAKLALTYEAEAELALVTTYDRYGTLNGAGGLYETRAECDAALAAEVAHFEVATALEPFVSYCYEDVFADALPYGFHIDAFGTPVKAPQLESTHVFGEPVGIEPAALAAAIRTGLEGAGADIRFVKFEPAAGDFVLGVGSYGTEAAPLRLDGVRVAYLDSAAQCTASLALANAAFTEVRGATPLASFCTSDEIMSYYTVYMITLGSPQLYQTSSIERFRSYEECETARPDLVRTYRDDYGRPVVGATCSRDAVVSSRDAWTVMLLESR